MSTEKQSRNLHQRIAAVMQEVSYIQKDEKPVDGKYRPVRFDDVVAKLRPVLIKHGILVFSSVVEHAIVAEWDRGAHYTMTSATVDVTFVNADDKSDTLTVRSFGYGVDSQDKGAGKAITYAVKYACLRTFFLETGDAEDPDMNQGPEFDRPAQKPAAESTARRPAPKVEPKPAPVKADPADNDRMRNEIVLALAKVYGNQASRIRTGLVKLTEFTGKDGKPHSCDNIDKLTGKWLTVTHKRALELAEQHAAEEENQSQDDDGPSYDENGDELPF